MDDTKSALKQIDNVEPLETFSEDEEIGLCFIDGRYDSLLIPSSPGNLFVYCALKETPNRNN
jgi:hypothetical protein